MADQFKKEKIPSMFAWDFSPRGQHVELGIAEMNLFIMLSALGLSHEINGERLLPVGTLYDPFIQRRRSQGADVGKIGRASCRERAGQYVSILVVAVSLKKKTTNKNNGTQ